jgi:prepilin-type N-terminal cleavage/methylation domain-containing protein
MRVDPRRQDRGFTLVELMIVVGVIGVIASLAIPNYLRFTARTHRTEMLETVSKIKLYLKNVYDNNGTFSTGQTLAAGASSQINPDPTAPGAQPLGLPDKWNTSLNGWTDFQFPPEGGVRMRYSYTMGSADGSGNVQDLTITVCGAFTSLGPNLVTCPGSMLGNYLYTEVFHGNGTSDPPVEIPQF